MKLLIDIDIKPLNPPINFQDRIMVVGSCFTEHIGGRLAGLKFNVLQNPNGILFDPLSVASSLHSYMQNLQLSNENLVELNGIFYSWQHHSRFSGLEKNPVVQAINESQNIAHSFLKDASWLILTLGSAFSYQLTTDKTPVANCHKAPAQTFKKVMVSTEEIINVYKELLTALKQLNPKLNIVFTISPVRHIRDGVIENNRSKARLIEAVHTLVEQHSNAHYFPAYELVIDVLRDYRFYDIDLVHPNYAATEFVFEKFAETCIDQSESKLMEEIRKIRTAARHKPTHPSSEVHQKFLLKTIEQVAVLQQKHPQLNFSEELEIFEKQLSTRR